MPEGEENNENRRKVRPSALRESAISSPALGMLHVAADEAVFSDEEILEW
jgi:hypothetical protein